MDTAVGRCRIVKELDQIIARNDDDKQIAELLLRQTDVIQCYFDFEPKKPVIDERMVNNEKLRDDRIAKAEENYTAACPELLRKKSDIKMKIEALLKSGDEEAILRSLEDA